MQTNVENLRCGCCRRRVDRDGGGASDWVCLDSDCARRISPGRSRSYGPCVPLRPPLGVAFDGDSDSLDSAVAITIAIAVAFAASIVARVVACVGAIVLSSFTNVAALIIVAWNCGSKYRGACSQKGNEGLDVLAMPRPDSSDSIYLGIHG